MSGLLLSLLLALGLSIVGLPLLARVGGRREAGKGERRDAAFARRLCSALSGSRDPARRLLGSPTMAGRILDVPFSEWTEEQRRFLLAWAAGSRDPLHEAEGDRFHRFVRPLGSFPPLPEEFEPQAFRRSLERAGGPQNILLSEAMGLITPLHLERMPAPPDPGAVMKGDAAARDQFALRLVLLLPRPTDAPSSLGLWKEMRVPLEGAAPMDRLAAEVALRALARAEAAGASDTPEFMRAAAALRFSAGLPEPEKPAFPQEAARLLGVAMADAGTARKG